MESDCGGGQLHCVTPLIKSLALGTAAGTSCRVLLKLDNAQPSGSFKIRGIGALCQKAKAEGKIGVVCSSGGNAGLAAAYACRKLALQCSIYVPRSTPQLTVDRLKSEGANVTVAGDIWNEANTEAQTYYTENSDKLLFVHPFDHPHIWTGHSSIILEIKDQMPPGSTPSCIVTCVGGGGLLTGILEGLQAVGWADVPVVAMETEGADSLAACVKAGALVSIPTIASIAKSLGSTTICSQLFEYLKTRPVISDVVTDADAVSACLRFADDHRMLVEPACGASLAAIYSGRIKKMQTEGRLPTDLDTGAVVVIVCGGSSITIEMLKHYESVLSESNYM